MVLTPVHQCPQNKGNNGRMQILCSLRLPALLLVAKHYFSIQMILAHTCTLLNGLSTVL